MRGTQTNIRFRLLGIRIGVAALLLTLPGCTTFHSSEHGDAATDTHTLRVAIGTDIVSFDPANSNGQTDDEMQLHFFEGLVRFDANNRIEPCLAQSWDLSADGKTYTFHIRHGVKFHNGRELVASDIKYSWERAIGPESKSVSAANYVVGIVGVPEVLAHKRRDISGVTVVDPATLRVTLDRPRAYFLGMLTYPTNFVVCKEAVEANGGMIDAKSVVGTGGFRFVSYTPGQRVLCRANPDYWDGKPPIDNLDVEIMTNADTAYNNFLTRQVDITGTTVSHYVQDQAAGKLQANYHLVPNASVTFLALYSGRQPAFARKEVREAFLYAIDRDAIARIAYKGIAQVADGMLPPGMLGSTPSPPHIACDPAKARQLLAQAGYPNGKGFPTLTLTYAQNNPTSANVCQIIRSELQTNLGISVNLAEREFGQYVNEYYAGKLEMFLAGWVADYPDPQDFLSTLLVSDASVNHYGYRSPQFDSLCNQADQEPDLSRRGALYARANRLLMDDAAVVPIAFPPRPLLVQSNIQGWRSNLCVLLPHTKTTKLAH